MLFVLGVTAYIKENGWCVQFDVLQGQLTCFRLMKYMYLKGEGVTTLMCMFIMENSLICRVWGWVWPIFV